MSIFKTNEAMILYTVVDKKVVAAARKHWQKKIDDQYNKEQELIKQKEKECIGKEFVVIDTTDSTAFKHGTFNVEHYIEQEFDFLKKKGIKSFLAGHNWTMRQLCDYFTKVNSATMPITDVVIA